MKVGRAMSTFIYKLLNNSNMNSKTIVAVAVLSLTLAACNQRQNATPAAASTEVATQTQSADAKAQMTGEISHDTWQPGEQASVSFQEIPSTIEQFSTLQSQLGVEPQGAVALQVIAFEMYRRDASLGEQALTLNNTSTNLLSTLRQLKEMMNLKDAYYSRPYIAAALMKGATPENGYQPERPYTVQMRVDPARAYQQSNMLGGTVIYLQVDSKGWDTNWRGVEVVKPEHADYYLVSNCPALYTQCKQLKDTWKPLD